MFKHKFLNKFLLITLMFIILSSVTIGSTTLQNSHSSSYKDRRDNKLSVDLLQSSTSDNLVTWKKDDGTILINNSDYTGPNANISIEWKETPASWNLTAIHGEEQFYNTTMKFPAGFTKKFFLQRGDTYQMTFNWNKSSTNLDFYLFDPLGNNKLGCDQLDLQSQTLCEEREPPTILTNYKPQKTGYYEILSKCEDNAVAQFACEVPLDVNVTISNKRNIEKIDSLQTQSYSYSTTNLLKGMLTLVAEAEINGLTKKETLTINMNTQPEPILNSFKIDNKIWSGTAIVVNRTDALKLEWNVQNRNPTSPNTLFFLWYFSLVTNTWTVVTSQNPVLTNLEAWDVSGELFLEGTYSIRLDVDDHVNFKSFYVNFTLVGKIWTSTKPITPTNPGFEIFSLIIGFFLLVPIFLNRRRN